MSRDAVDVEIVMTIERGDDAFDVIIQASYFADPGQLSGPPENCWEPSEDIVFKAILLDPSRTPWTGELTDDEEAYARDQIREEAGEVAQDRELRRQEMAYDSDF